jgi:hypothetical protein
MKIPSVCQFKAKQEAKSSISTSSHLARENQQSPKSRGRSHNKTQATSKQNATQDQARNLHQYPINSRPRPKRTTHPEFLARVTLITPSLPILFQPRKASISAPATTPGNKSRRRPIPRAASLPSHCHPMLYIISRSKICPPKSRCIPRGIVTCIAHPRPCPSPSPNPQIQHQTPLNFPDTKVYPRLSAEFCTEDWLPDRGCIPLTRN